MLPLISYALRNNLPKRYFQRLILKFAGHGLHECQDMEMYWFSAYQIVVVSSVHFVLYFLPLHFSVALRMYNRSFLSFIHPSIHQPSGNRLLSRMRNEYCIETNIRLGAAFLPSVCNGQGRGVGNIAVGFGLFNKR